MAKIIAVWGNSGSGKTTFSCLLARYLTKEKEKAIVIGPDMATPLLPTLFPNENIETSMSLGTLLSAPEIDSSLAASKVVLYQPYPFVGVIGHTAGETPLSYPEISYRKVQAVIRAAASLVDYLILDCTTQVVSAFFPAAMEAANAIVRILTPDLFGIYYFRAHQPLLSGPRFKPGQHISLAGKARPFHALEEMGHLLGGFAGILPYNKEIERRAASGEIFSSLRVCGPKYTAALEVVAQAVRQPETQEEKHEQFE